MKDLVRRFLNAKNSPILVAIFVILNGFIIAYAVYSAPSIAIVIIILVTFALALFVFAVTFISVNDQYRISPIVNQQYYVYEVINSKLEWEIIADDGSIAQLTKSRTIKFLDNDISTLREYIWGDVYSSHTLPLREDIEVHPGTISQIYAEGGMYVVVVLLDRPYDKNEELVISYKRKIRNGFLQEKEWVEFMPVTNSKHEIMRVKFPAARHVKNQLAKYRRGDYSESFMAGNQGFSKIVEDGKDILEWNIYEPVPRASYLIEWEW